MNKPLAGLIFYVVTLTASLVLMQFYLAPGVDVDSMARGIAGPTTWVKWMFYGTIVCALALCIRNARAHFREAPQPAEPAHHDPHEALEKMAGADSYQDVLDEIFHEEYDDRMTALGIAALVGYGAAIATIGFALATVLFIIVWCLLGGMRKVTVFLPVSIIGTVSLLYLFVKLTAMPLDRGICVFDSITVAIYKLLGIF